jgi:geranylgeranyl reductase family protein
VSSLRVAVVGAGPAGATSARLLAQMGAHVTLYDAKRLPRHKLCGGGLTPKALPYIPTEAFGAIGRRVAEVDVVAGVRRDQRLHLRLPGVEIAMVERAPFDFVLVQAAVACGVELRDATSVVEVVPRDGSDGVDGVDVRTRAGTEMFDLVIAADGEPSRIAHRLGLGPLRSRALALEVDLPFATDRATNSLELRYGVRGGYAWYFPKADHANVGILTTDQSRQAGLRDELRGYIRELGLQPGDGRIAGHWIPMGLRRGGPVRGRVLLVGDAAGTADPFFGEGLSYAMASAGIAASTIRDWDSGRLPDLRAYEGRLRDALERGFARMELAGRVNRRATWLAVTALRFSGWARQEAVRAVNGTRVPFELPPFEVGRLEPSAAEMNATRR